MLIGRLVQLRRATDGDVSRLVEIRATPEVRARWRGDDLEADVREAIIDTDREVYVVLDQDGAVVGAIQWAAEDDPEYRHASVDIYLDPAVHGRGLGTDAARTLCRYLISVVGHHRITIDPAADNVAAIRTYTKVGFRRVGVMHEYERGRDGSWHDGLLMDLLAGELIDEGPNGG